MVKETATIQEIRRIISLFEGIPREKVSEVLKSGILADLLYGDIASINRDDFRRSIGLKPLGKISFDTFNLDQRRYGWTLLEHTPRSISSKSKFELIPFMSEYERAGGILTEEMVRRASGKLNAGLGQEDAEWLLEHQAILREHLDTDMYLPFPGTVWRDSDGKHRIPILNHGFGKERKWEMHFGSFEDTLGAHGRLIRLVH